MAVVIKAYTDIEQGKILGKILSPESADTCWTNHLFCNILSSLRIESTSPAEYKNLLDYYHVQGYLIEPAWSLTALLNVLPSATLDSSDDHHYRLHCMERFTEWYDNPIDAYVAMIEKLHEKNIL